jgi:nucleoside-diphosphate-sugar epimerase
MHLLIIGGAGVVGRSLVTHLKAHRLTILDRAPAPSGSANIVGDATDLATLRTAMQGVDAVVHLAAIVPRGAEADDGQRIRDAFDVNVTGVYLALRAARERGIRHFVHISTMSVFRDYGRVPIDATSDPDSTEPYGQSKRLAEEVCAALSEDGRMTVTSLRLAFPTTDTLWPLWRSPGAPDAKPIRPSLADGTAFDALAPVDLARAVNDALTRRGGYAAVTVSGDTDGVTFIETPARRAIESRPERH